MATKTKKAVAKKSTAKSQAKKTAVKKKATKKEGAKKKAAPKKKVAVKKTPVKRRSSVKATTIKRTAWKKGGTSATKKKAVIPEKKPAEVKELNNLLVTGEKDTRKTAILTTVPGSNKKARQLAAVRNYNNHHLRLSTHSKGGIRPSGKKPLW